MYDSDYNDDLLGNDPDLLEAEADLLLGEDFDDGESSEEDLLMPHTPHKKHVIEGEDELDDLDGYEDDLDSFDFHDDLGDDLDTPEM